MIALNFIHTEDPDYVQPDSKTTFASTHTDPDDPDRLCIHLSADPDGNVVAEEVPWELMEDPDEDQDDTDLRAELAKKQRKLLINAVGLVAYVAGAALGISMGDFGFVVVLLMTLGLICMYRSSK